MSLDQLRSSIEEKDKAIITLIAERMNIARDIAREKRHQGLPVRIPDQAESVLTRAEEEAGRKGLDPASVRKIIQILIRMSEEMQEKWLEEEE